VSADLHTLFARVHGVITGPGERDGKLETICTLLRENVDRYDRVDFVPGEQASSTSGGRILLPVRKNGVVAVQLVVKLRKGSVFTDEDRQFLEGICTFVSGIL
jgi:putative methionine-R-sulfoxide reductase with GAF domain